MTAAAIDVRDLTVHYGGAVALDGITFSVKEGSVLGVLGRNGAGKTTLVRVLATQKRPTAGTASVAGHDVVRNRRDVQKLIGVTGQYAALDDDLSPLENLRLLAALHGLSAAPAAREIDRLAEQLDLADVMSRRLGQLSGGTRRRIDLAASLVASPEVVFLDEPTTGLDPHSRQRLWELVESLAGEGRTVVLTTQYLDEVDRLADHVLVLDGGAVVGRGTPRQLKSNIGGQRVAVAFADPADAPAAGVALGNLSDHVSTHPGGWLVAHADDADHAVDLVSALDRLGLPIQELAVTTPTLDDAFYALTAR